MFQFLFKYPVPVFTKGRFVLLGGWPAWALVVFILIAAGGLALLIQWRLRSAGRELRSWCGWVIWGLQSALVALVLVLLWQPAMLVSELNSQQNIIAVVVDDSRSMRIADSNGKTREDAAIAALENGVLAGLRKRFQTRVYRLGSELTRVDGLREIAPVEAATHIDEGLKRLATETADLPVGAILLLSDGSQNTAGTGGSSIGLDALQALRNRRLPVHAVGFGREEPAHDIEIEDVSVAATATAKARIAATISLTQHGYPGQKAKLAVHEGEKSLAEREISLPANGSVQTESLFFPIGAAGAKSLTFSVEPLAGEENLANNSA